MTHADSTHPTWISARWKSFSSAATEESFTQAKTWFHECTRPNTDHECSLPPEDFVPTRLIRIPASENVTSVNIVETGGVYVPWCALSYCWGGPQLKRTMKANLKNGSRSIALSELPATILDAILATHRLKIPYLWVDSLCIIQDDRHDLSRELAHMPKIYNNSTLTIVAAAAATCTEGFLRPRVPRLDPTYGPPISLRYEDELGAQGTIILHGTFRPSEPIHARAWTMQEQLLSPRMLLYNTSTLAWLCKSQTHTDAPNSAPINDPAINEFFSNFARTFSRQDLTVGDAVKLWLNILKHYSQRKLGFEEDRLTALSAIAAEFGKKTTWQYAAGLWTSYLNMMLGWWCESNSSHHRPEKYRAPSWSWASIHGIESFEIDYRDNIIPFMAPLDVEVEPAQAELPHGDAQSAHISTNCTSVRGTLRKILGIPYLAIGKAVFGKPSDELAAATPSTTVLLDAPVDDLIGWHHGSSWDIYLLPFNPFSESYPYLSLILKRLPGYPRRYQRVGVFLLGHRPEIAVFHGLLEPKRLQRFVIV